MIERWRLKEPRDISDIHPQALHQETFDAFGYFPKDISQMSQKKIAWMCLSCSKVSYSREKILGNKKPIVYLAIKAFALLIAIKK